MSDARERENVVLSRGFTNADFVGNPRFVEITPRWSLLGDAIDLMEQRVFGQREAVEAVARAVLRVKAGFCIPGKPEFVGIFSGPPGVGKTEMGMAVAELYHGANWEAHFKLVPCPIFQDRHEVARLIGSAPGYVGWGSPDSILIHPDFTKERNVIVFDEIEKAHPQLFRVLLGVLDTARLDIQVGREQYKDVKNTPLDFSKSTIILTSNIGSDSIHEALTRRGFGFNTQSEEVDIRSVGLKALQHFFAFMPEFLDRIPPQNRVVFDRLTPDVFRRIFDKFLRQVADAAGGANDQLMVTRELKDWIVGKIDPRQGARQLRALIDDVLLTPASLVRLRTPKGTPLVAGIYPEEGRLWFRVARDIFDAAREKELKQLIGGDTQTKEILARFDVAMSESGILTPTPLLPPPEGK